MLAIGSIDLRTSMLRGKSLSRASRLTKVADGAFFAGPKEADIGAAQKIAARRPLKYRRTGVLARHNLATVRLPGSRALSRVSGRAA